MATDEAYALTIKGKGPVSEVCRLLETLRARGASQFTITWDATEEDELAPVCDLTAKRRQRPDPTAGVCASVGAYGNRARRGSSGCKQHTRPVCSTGSDAYLASPFIKRTAGH